ncbi:MAG: chorismate mutase [Verrucomicrobiales bacterium]|nr:chorismate mutase [Verrucomicrobiales bacterium]
MSLEQARIQIDEIDQQLIRLLNQRAELVHEIGRIKRQDGLDIYVPGREEMLLRKLAAFNQSQNGLLTERAIRAIYREVMSAALALETSMEIAYLGPAGSWTHQVAINKFGNSVEYVAEASTEGVFERVSSGGADYGVLPIEHSAEGAVHHTLDHLADTDLQIYAEILWKTETVVMAARPDMEPAVIHGHPQVLAHCRAWLTQRFPAARLEESVTSSLAADAAATLPDHAALGTPLTAELHQLKAVATSPRAHATQARFIILGRRSGAPTGHDNTMLLVDASDKVGSLFSILQVFAEGGIDVRQIENRPVPGDETGNQARFFLEVSGHIDDDALAASVTRLRESGVAAKPLGSYPSPKWVEER